MLHLSAILPLSMKQSKLQARLRLACLLKYHHGKLFKETGHISHRSNAEYYHSVVETFILTLQFRSRKPGQKRRELIKHALQDLFSFKMRSHNKKQAMRQFTQKRLQQTMSFFHKIRRQNKLSDNIKNDLKSKIDEVKSHTNDETSKPNKSVQSVRQIVKNEEAKIDPHHSQAITNITKQLFIISKATLHATHMTCDCFVALCERFAKVLLPPFTNPTDLKHVLEVQFDTAMVSHANAIKVRNYEHNKSKMNHKNSCTNFTKRRLARIQLTESRTVDQPKSKITSRRQILSPNLHVKRLQYYRGYVHRSKSQHTKVIQQRQTRHQHLMRHQSTNTGFKALKRSSSPIRIEKNNVDNSLDHKQTNTCPGGVSISPIVSPIKDHMRKMSFEIFHEVLCDIAKAWTGDIKNMHSVQACENFLSRLLNEITQRKTVQNKYTCTAALILKPVDNVRCLIDLEGNICKNGTFTKCDYVSDFLFHYSRQIKECRRQK